MAGTTKIKPMRHDKVAVGIKLEPVMVNNNGLVLVSNRKRGHTPCNNGGNTMVKRARLGSDVMLNVLNWLSATVTQMDQAVAEALDNAPVTVTYVCCVALKLVVTKVIIERTVSGTRHTNVWEFNSLTEFKRDGVADTEKTNRLP